MPGLPAHVLVRDSEEKGSDVNLATRLLVDGFNGEYEQAVVVSNDADFAAAMRYVRDDLGLRVLEESGTEKRRLMEEGPAIELRSPAPSETGNGWRGRPDAHSPHPGMSIFGTCRCQTP